MKSGSYRQKKEKSELQYWELLNKVRVLKNFKCPQLLGTRSWLLQRCSAGAHLAGERDSPVKSLCSIETVLGSRTKPNIFISQLLLWQEIKYIHISSFLENVNYFGSYKPNTEEKIQQFIISNPSKSPHPPSTHPSRCPVLPSWAATGPSTSGFCEEEWK